MAKAARKSRAKKRPPLDNKAILKAHTKALDRHAKALESFVSSTNFQTFLAGTRHFSPDQIKGVICAKTGNPSLNDSVVFGKLFAGTGGVADSIVDQINHGFGPPPLTLTFAQIAPLTMGQLVGLISRIL